MLLTPQQHQNVKEYNENEPPIEIANALSKWTSAGNVLKLFSNINQSSRQVQLFRASPTDAVVGACLSSAAELESSKQYMQQDDGWNIAYMVSTLHNKHWNGIRVLIP